MLCRRYCQDLNLIHSMIKEIKIWILFHRSGIPIYSIVDVVVVVFVERKHKNSATGSIFSVDYSQTLVVQQRVEIKTIERQQKVFFVSYKDLHGNTTPASSSDLSSLLLIIIIIQQTDLNRILLLFYFFGWCVLPVYDSMHETYTK